MLNAKGLNGKSIKDQLKEQLMALEKEEANETVVQKAMDSTVGKPLEKFDVHGITTRKSLGWPEKLTHDQRELFGIGLKDLRNKLGYAQEYLGKLCNFQIGYVSNLENGKVASISFGLLGTLAHNLQNDLIDLMKSVLTPAKNHNTTNNETDQRRAYTRREPSGLIFDQERTYKLRGDGFEFRCSIDDGRYKLEMIEAGASEDVLIWKGTNSSAPTFVAALKQIAKLIEKGV